jgi:hypothetical protein
MSAADSGGVVVDMVRKRSVVPEHMLFALRAPAIESGSAGEWGIRM